MAYASLLRPLQRHSHILELSRDLNSSINQSINQSMVYCMMIYRRRPKPLCLPYLITNHLYSIIPC